MKRNIVGALAVFFLGIHGISAAPATYDLSREFSLLSNPNGVWSYGRQETVGGAFTLFGLTQINYADGVPILVRLMSPNTQPAILHNDTTQTVVTAGGGNYPPETTWFGPGVQGYPGNYAVARFTAPTDGTYQLVTRARPAYGDSVQLDTDFHVTRNNVEIFGAALNGGQIAGYTNHITLAAGDTIDFAVGRGADNSYIWSGLKVEATLDRTSTNPVPPTIVAQPESQTVTEGEDVTLLVAVSGTSPLSYQWRKGSNALVGANSSTLTLNDVQASDAGSYSVVVSNAYGVATSDTAVLTVNAAPPTADHDLSRDFSLAGNPNGVWSYGRQETVGGAFTLFGLTQTNVANGVPILVSLMSPNTQPAILHNDTTQTVVTGGGGNYPPETTWFGPGVQGYPGNYAVARFTAPADGTYQLVTRARPAYGDSVQLDTDFHVTRNDVEIFGAALNGAQTAGYTNTIALAAGDTIDFAVGRGADNSYIWSGLKVEATLTRQTNGVTELTLVVPKSAETNDTTFGGGVLVAANFRHQQVYGSVEFPSGSLLIRELRFRPDRVHGKAFSTTISNIQINMSTTQRNPTALSGVYAENVGSDDTVVFDGALAISSQFVGPANGPKAFDIIVPLEQPFLYDPANGNLVIDFRNFSGSSASTLSGQTGPDSAGRVLGALGAASGTIDTGADAIQIVYSAPINPPPPAVDFDLSRDFSLVGNPNGAWSYGRQDTIGGAFTLLGTAKTNYANAAVLVWAINSYSQPAILHNDSGVTVITDGGHGNYPPETTWFAPGPEGQPGNYAVTRFTVPAGGDGTYQLMTTARPSYSASLQLDTDFHVTRNNVEIFAVALSGTETAGYTNSIVLAAGDTIDFAVGRGADDSYIWSGLKVEATLDRTSTNPVPPTIVAQPESQTVTEGEDVTFAVVVSGTSPLNYQWRKGGNALSGATGSTLTLDNVQLSDAGSYSVVVSNAYGVATSDAATLTVNAAPPIADHHDLSRDFSLAGNPNGVWSYGRQETVGGAFTLFGLTQINYADGVPILVSLMSPNTQPAILHNDTTQTVVTAGGGNYPPETTWFGPGVQGYPGNYAVARFTAPTDGTYRLVTRARPAYGDTVQLDTDFHVTRNNVEIFGAALNGAQIAGYTNTIALAAGDTIDLAVGRGADNSYIWSGLKVEATLTRQTNGVSGLTLVVPKSAETNDTTFGGGVLVAANFRHQQVYGSVEFPSGSILIQELRFRPDRVHGKAFNTTVSNIQINMSTTQRNPTALSGVYAENVGPDDTLVFDGALSISSQFVGPANGPKAFDIIVPLEQPFLYDPAEGNLVIDFRNFSGSSASTLSGQTGPDSAGRVLGALGSASGTIDTGADAIQIVYSAATNPPPPAVDYDLSRDFSLAGNPNGAWSYGRQDTIGGAFTLLGTAKTNYDGSGVPIILWAISMSAQPAILHNASGQTAVTGGGGNYPPGTTWFAPGPEGQPGNYAVARLTVPAGGSGTYQLVTGARPAYGDSVQLDTDFHVLKNNVEVFGVNLNGSQTAGYTNSIALVAGDRIDFVVGRGVDNSYIWSGLKIEARLTQRTNDVSELAVVVPSGNENREGEGGSSLLRDAIRLQEVYGSALFPSGQLLTIREIRLRPSVRGGAAFTATISNLQINLSTTHIQPDAMNASFGANVGSNDTVAFSGPITLSSGFVGPAGGPKAFDIVIPLTTPFVYNPAEGNLLVDWRNHSGSTAAIVDTAGLANDSASRAFSLNASSTTAAARDTGAEILQLVYTLGTPPPSSSVDYDLSRDFSLAGNPNGVWSYGRQETVGGAFTLFGLTQINYADGVPILVSLMSPNTQPAILHNDTTQTVVTAGGGNYPPETTWFGPGVQGYPGNYAVARFTAPTDGTYRLVTRARPAYGDTVQLDTDFHVTRNNVEIFGAALNGAQIAGYTNTIALAAGDTIDLAVGRGADNSYIWSGLKVEATLDRVSSNGIAPTIVAQPQGQMVTEWQDVTFTVGVSGSAPLTYQWRKGGHALAGATNSTLTLNDVQVSDAGSYSVVVSNAYGVATSDTATLTVNTSPAVADYDLSRDFSLVGNPNGAWSYGRQETVGGAFTLFGLTQTNYADGIPILVSLMSPNTQPAILHNDTTQTAVTAGGGNYPPETTWFAPGVQGYPGNYAVARLRVPAGGDGTYQLMTRARPAYADSVQLDTDFHVLKNNTEVFGAALSGGQSAGYTNTIALSAGDTIDFVVGRGTDNSYIWSGLKVEATLTQRTNDVSGLALVVPSGNENSEGQGGSSLLRDAIRLQEVYGSTLFPSGQLLTIREIRLRPSIRGGAAFTATLSNLRINLSTTQVQPDAMNASFGANVGSNDTVVFSGPITLSSGFVGPAGGPKAFDIVIPLTTPFVYNPAEGNLLVDWRNHSGSTATIVDTAGLVNDGASRAFSLDASSTTAAARDTGAEILQLVYTLGTPPPPSSVDYDLSRDFAMSAGNPNGAWSYGWQGSLGGAFRRFTHSKYNYDPAGVPVEVWDKPHSVPAVMHNNSSATVVTDGGQGNFPPETTWFYPGVEGYPENFGVIRFTVPRGQRGTYAIAVTARPAYNGPMQGDTDFHVLKNGVEVFTQALAGSASASYSNSVALAAGDTIDFVIGRGADDSFHGSGLKISATLHRMSPNLRPHHVEDSGASNGEFVFSFNAAPGNYTVEGSTNLLHWVTLTNVFGANGPIHIVDPEAATLPRRFYRARNIQ
jgi:hypothetical protein